MKPFNLEVALKGHPVVTRDGREVTDIHHFKDPLVDIRYTLYAQVQGRVEKFTKKGHFYYSERESDYDLFLKDCDWQPEPEEGDVVLVRDTDEEEWQERILLYKTRNNHLICVSGGDERDYNKNEYYVTDTWKQMKPLPQKPSFEITIKINGKTAKLSDISEETLITLRKEN
jgi:hypothetical protein